MFNVTKSLKKLKEIREEYIPENYMIDRKALEEILIAGQEDEFDLLEFQRGYFSGHKDAMKDIEERLARLEKIIGILQRDLPEPSKSTELNKACEEFYKGDGWNPLQSKAEGKTPDYLMGIEGKTPDYLIGGKPEKPVMEEKPTIDITDMYKSTCKEHGNIICDCTMPDDKPSEFISIPRDVAEEWLKAHKDDTRAFCFMWDEVRNALEG